MRRVPEFLRWRANWWASQKIHEGTLRPDLQQNERQREGHDAYATRQARMLRSIAARFEEKWEGVTGLIAEGRAQVAAAEAEAAEAAATAAAAISDERSESEGGESGSEDDGDDEAEEGGDNEDEDEGDEDESDD